jgi:hypothetical protein
MNEESSQSGMSLMAEIEIVEERLAVQAELQRELLEFAKELKASIDLAHWRISEVVEALVKLGHLIGGPASPDERHSTETPQSAVADSTTSST